MARRTFRSLIKDDGGAVAATYALALVALIAIGGVAFDYGRMVSVDTELQNAADQAALAAATQLDLRADSITRAQSAVTQYFSNSGSAVVNRTLLANDGAGSAITGVSFTFYKSYDSATDTFGAVTTVGTEAAVVMVSINARRAYYALTPIVGALNSGDMTGNAVAGLQAAICKTPPMMVCSPSGDFPTESDIGKGLLLQPGSAGMWAPGTFGYLDFGNGATMVKELLGANDGADVCVPGTGVQAQNGNIASAPDYLNTRFDIYTNPLRPADCEAGGANCPAASTRKDLVRQERYTYNNVAADSIPARPACDPTVTSQGQTINVTEWVQVPTASLPASNRVEGFPRDTCHTTGSSNSTGTCAGGNFGDKVWDLTGYQAAHPNVPTGLTSRYAIYQWERDNQGSGLQPTLVNSGDPAVVTGCNAAGKNCEAVWNNYCSYPSAIKGTYHPTSKDRRLMTIAVVDCSGDTGGNHVFTVKRWMDVFLTEPSWDRNVPYTRASQIYAEIVGPATTPSGGNAFQYYGRNKAVLLR